MLRATHLINLTVAVLLAKDSFRVAFDPVNLRTAMLLAKVILRVAMRMVNLRAAMRLTMVNHMVAMEMANLRVAMTMVKHNVAMHMVNFKAAICTAVPRLRSTMQMCPGDGCISTRVAHVSLTSGVVYVALNPSFLITNGVAFVVSLMKSEQVTTPTSL